MEAVFEPFPTPSDSGKLAKAHDITNFPSLPAEVLLIILNILVPPSTPLDIENTVIQGSSWFAHMRRAVNSASARRRAIYDMAHISKEVSSRIRTELQKEPLIFDNSDSSGWHESSGGLETRGKERTAPLPPEYDVFMIRESYKSSIAPLPPEYDVFMIRESYKSSIAPLFRDANVKTIVIESFSRGSQDLKGEIPRNTSNVEHLCIMNLAANKMAATFLSNLLSLPKRLKTLKIGFDCSRRNESFSRSLDRQNLLCDFDQKALVSALMCQRNSLESLTLTCNNRPVSTNKFHSTMPLRLPMFNFVTQLSIPRLWLVRNGRQGFIDCHYRLPLNVKLLQVINGAGYRMDYGRCGTNEWLMLVLENRPTKLRNLEKVVIIMTKMPKGTRSGDEKLDSALAYEDDTSDDEEETDLKTYIRRAESTPLRRLLWVTTWTLARTVDVKIKLKVQENIEDEPV